VAAPIFAKVMDAVWGDLGPRTFMRPAAARRQLVDLPTDAHSGALSRKGRRAAVEHPDFDAQHKLDDDQTAPRSAHKPHKATPETSRHSTQRPRGATADTSLSTNARTEPAARQPIGRSGPLNGQQQELQGFWPENGLYDQGRDNRSDFGNRSDWDERLNAH
jgi:hypothetical protein